MGDAGPRDDEDGGDDIDAIDDNAPSDDTGAADVDTTDGGTYSLLLDVAPTTVEVGALGSHDFDTGTYVYTGSAFGPGGFARVERHRELAAGERSARHWHVDYLLGAAATTVVGVWTSPGADCECAVAGALPGASVTGFGASDCECDAHLVAVPDRERAERALDELHERRGLPE